MFILKKKYYLIVENTKDINLKNIKKRNKFVIIYRNKKNSEKKENLLKFRKECKLKLIHFYVANDINLAIELSSLSQEVETASHYALPLKQPNSLVEQRQKPSHAL